MLRRPWPELTSVRACFAGVNKGGRIFCISLRPCKIKVRKHRWHLSCSAKFLSFNAKKSCCADGWPVESTMTVGGQVSALPWQCTGTACRCKVCSAQVEKCRFFDFCCLFAPRHPRRWCQGWRWRPWRWRWHRGCRSMLTLCARRVPILWASISVRSARCPALWPFVLLQDRFNKCQHYRGAGSSEARRNERNELGPKRCFDMAPAVPTHKGFGSCNEGDGSLVQRQ